MAGKGKTLILTVDSYDQPQKDDSPQLRRLKTYSRGEKFDAVSDEEYERLIEIEAAVDPKKQNEQAREQAEQRLAALQAERESLEAQIEDTKADADPSSLTKPELVSRLEEAGQDSSGTKDELAARYAAYQASQE